MSLVKWVHEDHLSDERYPLDVAFEGVIPVIPLSALTEVVEELDEVIYSNMSHDFQAGQHNAFMRLLAQLAPQKGGGDE